MTISSGLSPHCDVVTANKISAHSAASHHLCFSPPEGTENFRSLTCGAPAMEIWGAASNCPTPCLPATIAPAPGAKATAVKVPEGPAHVWPDASWAASLWEMLAFGLWGIQPVTPSSSSFSHSWRGPLSGGTPWAGLPALLLEMLKKGR